MIISEQFNNLFIDNITKYPKISKYFKNTNKHIYIYMITELVGNIYDNKPIDYLKFYDIHKNIELCQEWVDCLYQTCQELSINSSIIIDRFQSLINVIHDTSYEDYILNKMIEAYKNGNDITRDLMELKKIFTKH